MSYNDEKTPLNITLDQFETNIKYELKMMGESTKRESNILGDLFMRNKPEQVYWFKSPFTSFTCTTENGYVKNLEIALYIERMNKKSLEKALIPLRKYYYACGLAIEKEYAKLEYETFMSLRAVHLPHFHSTLMNPVNTPWIKIQMWLT